MGPDYSPPVLEPPAEFTADLERGLEAGRSDLGTWWTQLGDPALDALIERALRGNLDLRVALARVQEARARRGIRRTELVPTLDLTGDYRRIQ